MQQFKYVEIPVADLASDDLKREASAGARAYRINVTDEDGSEIPEPAECLLLEGKVGFAWGSDVYWGMSGGNVHQDIHIWLNDEEEWEGRELH
jgi:hypothetical protein